MDGNSLHEAQALCKQLAAVAELINSRNEQSALRMEGSARTLRQDTQKLTGSGERLAQDALSTLRAQGAQVLSQGTEEALGKFERQMQQSTSQARQLEEEVLEQHRHGVLKLIRVALIVLVVGAVLAIGGSIYVAYDRSRVIENAQFGQDLLQATNSGIINRCGSKLCVRVGKKPERYSQNPDYVLIGE